MNNSIAYIIIFIIVNKLISWISGCSEYYKRLQTVQRIQRDVQPTER